MDIETRIAALPCWRGPVTLEPLAGGMTNRNLLARAGGERFVVRLGEDIPVHGVMRFNELAASRAAHAAGLSPEVVHAEPGLMVLRFVAGTTLTSAMVRKPARLPGLVDIVRRCHREIPRHLRGPVLSFNVFHVARDYIATLRATGRYDSVGLDADARRAAELESRVGPIDLVFGHNDLLAANLIDDGARLWLIDWDYAGFNSPLFDLGGLAPNNGFDEDHQRAMLALYFGAPADDALRRRYRAMTCASLLRETLWSMVSEATSTVAGVDFAAHTADNRAHFETAWASLDP